MAAKRNRLRAIIGPGILVAATGAVAFFILAGWLEVQTKLAK